MGNITFTIPVQQPETNEETTQTIEKQIVKKALMIGINYEGTSFSLNGCINDSINLKEFMVRNKYFTENEVTFMTDHSSMQMKPTKSNMLREFDNLVDFANKNQDKDVYLFVSYSGHGYYVKDVSGDELDGQDEVLCPLDCNTNGFITDDVIKARLVDKLGFNVKLVMLVDACHSGTVLDLKYNYKLDSNNSVVTNAKNSEPQCDVVMISGCRDDQTSADAYLKDNTTNKYEYQGAMTASFIMNFTDQKTTKDLVVGMRNWLKNSRFTQVPQFASGRKLDVNRPFLLSCYDN